MTFSLYRLGFSQYHGLKPCRNNTMDPIPGVIISNQIPWTNTKIPWTKYHGPKPCTRFSFCEPACIRIHAFFSDNPRIYALLSSLTRVYLSFDLLHWICHLIKLSSPVSNLWVSCHQGQHLNHNANKFPYYLPYITYLGGDNHRLSSFVGIKRPFFLPIFNLWEFFRGIFMDSFEPAENIDIRLVWLLYDDFTVSSQLWEPLSFFTGLARSSTHFTSPRHMNDYDLLLKIFGQTLPAKYPNKQLKSAKYCNIPCSKWKWSNFLNQ